MHAACTLHLAQKARGLSFNYDAMQRRQLAHVAPGDQGPFKFCATRDLRQRAHPTLTFLAFPTARWAIASSPYHLVPLRRTAHGRGGDFRCESAQSASAKSGRAT